ncbi:MAG: hypothetical protein PSY14_02130 [bacterium]|nr:hypothetical protein [bacterium]
MATGLTDAAAKVFGKEEIDRILSLPITQMRIELKHAYQDKEFTQEQFESFVDRLAKVDNLNGQAALAKQAAEKREVGDAIDIELNSPAKQLLWAAVMTRMMRADEKAKVSSSKLWTQMQDTVGFNNEAIGVSKVIARSLQNSDTTFDWGAPGTWFYYHPKKNHINIDMYYTLLMGFEHVRAVHLHEIGHSELSNTYSPTMKKLYEKVKVLIDPSTVNPESQTDPTKKKPRIKMKKAEYRQLMLDVAEWQLRFKLWHMTEDTVVNQFSANKSGEINQNFGNSLNYVSAVLQGFGELMSGDAYKRDVKVSSDAPPDANDPKRAAWEEKQQKKEDVEKERADRLRRATTPLTDDEVKDIQAGNITKEVAKKMFDQINTAVLLAYYEQNGLFRGVDKNWERAHIIPQDIRRAIDVSNIPGAAGKDSFEYLIDMSVGQVNPNRELMRIPLDRQRAITHMADQAQIKQATSSFLDLANAFADLDDKDHEGKTPEILAADYAHELLAKLKVTNLPPGADPVEAVLFLAAKAHGIRNLQPQAADRILQHDPYQTLQDSYRAVVGYTSEQRGMVMEHVWDTYLKPYADVILKAYEEKLDRKAEQKKQQQKDKKEDQKQQGQKGQKGQQGGEGQSGDGEGSSSGGADSEPDTSDNDSDDGEGQDSGIEITDDENDGETKDGDPSDDNEKDGDPSDEKDEDGKGGAGDDDEVELDDDDMKQIGDLNEDPNEGREQEAAENEANGNDADGADNDGKDQNGKDEKNQPKKVSDFKDKEPAREDLSEKEKQERREAAKNMPDGNKLDRNTAQDTQDIDLAKLAKGDYRDFNRRVYELSPVISQQARIYRSIRAEQRRAIRKMSRDQHSFIASDGNFLGRFDMEKSRRTKLKQAFGQPVNVEDFKKIKRDEQVFADSTIEIISLIDGSGSMPQKKLGNGVNAMEVALQSAVINYMAARKAGIDGWIIIWGNAKPLVVASPDMPLKEVGENVQRVRTGINSGTALAPGFDTTMEKLADHRNKNGTISGSSHIMVYSDGEIQDADEAQKRIEAIIAGTKNVSIDVAVLVNKGSREAPTEMERMINKITAKSGDRKVGVLRGDDARTVPLELSRRTLQRVKRFKVEVVPDERKRAVYKAVSRKLNEM